MIPQVTRWLVGMDLRATSAGALRYAAWLHEHGGESASLRALHVIEHVEQHYAISLGLHSRRRLLELTAEATREALRNAGVEACFEDVDVLAGGAADDVLDEQLTAGGIAGLVVGRQGPMREGFPPRLGRVARRLLRHAGGPVIVVPPELEPSRLGGPVVLGTDLGSSSSAAVRFAAERAREWSRPLLVVHVVRGEGGLSFLPRDAREGARVKRHRAQREAVEQWVAAQDFTGIEVDLELPSGSPIDELLTIARRDCALVVCGARRLSWVERRLEASHATTLSSHAPVPVAVVPPDDSKTLEQSP